MEWTITLSKNDIKNHIKGYIKFQAIPFTAVGTAFTILKFLTLFGIYKIENPNFFLFFQHPVVIALLAIGSFVYIYRFYRERWDLKYKNSKLRHYHAAVAFAIGLLAATTPYLFNLDTLFFYTINAVFQAHSGNDLWKLSGFTLVFTLFLNDIFRSMDGKSGYLFSMRKNGPVWMEGVVNHIKKKYF